MRLITKKDMKPYMNFLLTPHAADRFEERLSIDDLALLIDTCIMGYESLGTVNLYSQGVLIIGRIQEEVFIIRTVFYCSKKRYVKRQRAAITTENRWYDWYEKGKNI